MSHRVEIRHRESGIVLFATPAAAGEPTSLLGDALAAAVAADIDLTGAELRDVDARGAELRGAKLAQACLSGAILDGCDLSGAILTDALMLRVSAVDASFDRAELAGAHAWAAVLTGASFKGVHAVAATFDDAAMQQVDLQGCDLTDASLLRADLTGADLRRAALNGTDLRGATLEGARLESNGTGPLLGDCAPEDWSESAEGPDHAKTVFHWKRSWLIRAGPGAALASILGGWMSFQLAAGAMGEGLAVFGRMILAAMFAAFGLSLGGAAIIYVAALFRRMPVVTIERDGIRDSRLSDKPIPWEEITGCLPALHGGQMMLMLQVTAPARFGLSRNPLWAINRLCSRLLGRPELSIRMTGLDGDLEGLLKAIQLRDCAPPPVG